MDAKKERIVEKEMREGKKKVSSSMIWSMAEKAGRYGITLLTSIVLARILEPEQYGIVAVVTVFINIANIFVQEGIGQAIIQKSSAGDDEISTVLLFNVLLSILIYAVLFVASPFIEIYYNMDGLSKVIRIMTLSIIISAAGNILQSKISKELEFKKLFLSSIFAVVISGALGIYSAYMGSGVWALVIQYLSFSFANTVVLFLVADFRFSLSINFKNITQVISLGLSFLGTALILNIGTEIRTLVIGKKYSPGELAFVNKGQQLASVPLTVIQTSTTAVMYPVLASCKDDRIRIRVLTRDYVQVSSFLIFPVLFGLAATAETVIVLLLTEKWLMCVPYFVLYCFIWVLNPVQMAHLQAIKALGKGGVLLKLQTLKTLISIAILFGTIVLFDSTIAIVCGALVSEIICTIITMPLSKKLYQYTYRMQAGDILPSLLLSVFLYIIVKTTGLLELNIYLQFVLQVIVGILSYTAISLVFKPAGFITAMEMIKTIKR